jgi:hypothetical protein
MGVLGGVLTALLLVEVHWARREHAASRAEW